MILIARRRVVGRPSRSRCGRMRGRSDSAILEQRNPVSSGQAPPPPHPEPHPHLHHPHILPPCRRLPRQPDRQRHPRQSCHPRIGPPRRRAGVDDAPPPHAEHGERGQVIHGVVLTVAVARGIQGDAHATRGEHSPGHHRDAQDPAHHLRAAPSLAGVEVSGARHDRQQVRHGGVLARDIGSHGAVGRHDGRLGAGRGPVGQEGQGAQHGCDQDEAAHGLAQRKGEARQVDRRERHPKGAPLRPWRRCVDVRRRVVRST